MRSIGLRPVNRRTLLEWGSFNRPLTIGGSWKPTVIYAGKLIKEAAMRRMRYWVSSSLVALVLFVSSGRMSAQSATNSFVPFNVFMARTAAASFDPSAGKVDDAASFEQMRHHIQDLYEGVVVTHSYVLGSQTFDCIPIDQQPSARKLGLNGALAIPTPPALPA